MKVIGVLSDTHACTHPKVFDFFQTCDQLWHAGDIGNMETLTQLAEFKPVVAVYGNIDDTKIRATVPEFQYFMCEECKVMMTHISGYPGRYEKGIPSLLSAKKPTILVGGHSHILRVKYDEKYDVLYINPGAAGKSGFHSVITAVRFEIEGKDIRNMEVLHIERN